MGCGSTPPPATPSTPGSHSGHGGQHCPKPRWPPQPAWTLHRTADEPSADPRSVGKNKLASSRSGVGWLVVREGTAARPHHSPLTFGVHRLPQQAPRAPRALFTPHLQDTDWNGKLEIQQTKASRLETPLSLSDASALQGTLGPSASPRPRSLVVPPPQTRRKCR